MRSCFSGETAHSSLSQGKDVYELEVCLNKHTHTHRDAQLMLLYTLSASPCLVGIVTNKGVGDPVSQTRNPLSERRATVCFKGKHISLRVI